MAETDPTAEDHLIDSPLKPGEPHIFAIVHDHLHAEIPQI